MWRLGQLRYWFFLLLLAFILISCFNVYFPYFPLRFISLGSSQTISSSSQSTQVTTNSSDKLSSKSSAGTTAKSDEFEKSLQVINFMGKGWTTFEDLQILMKDAEENSTASNILSRMRVNVTQIQERPAKLRSKSDGNSTNITVALVSCGSRHKQALVMLKSVVMFSQDASLHVILFGDKKTILDVGQDILALKWTANALGWDFTYELHLEWFPTDSAVKWRKMYTPCATERLFFPSLLPHIDSLIYLDTDTIMVSNLTEFWLTFPKHMKEDKLAALAANNEDTAVGWYNTMAKTPYYGNRGLNAGVMLMNLTQMRNFSFEAKALAAHTLYEPKIQLADQDIINIIFHEYPEKLHQLDCTYNFNWVHCGHEQIYICHDKDTGLNKCFCNATFHHGIQVVHGNGKTFYSDYFKFISHLYSEFEKFNLLTDSPKELFHNLVAHFSTLPKPCEPLTAEMMYVNALQYFQNLNL